MKTAGTFLPGLMLVSHTKYSDHRGNFCEVWKSADGMRGTHRQLHMATSTKNVLRGLHRQNQTKLVMPVTGEILDVVVEPETGNWFSVVLNEKYGLLIPPQYAHGYLVLSDTAMRKHATGVYGTNIPYDAEFDMATIDYADAEARGYMKLDLLNVHVYNHVKSEEHLVQLMREPNWDKLKDAAFVSKLIHLNGQYNNMQKMPEPINSIPRLAMFLSIIRPGKKHLIGLRWAEIAKTVWDTGTDGYSFKRSHSCSYSFLVVVHMNLLEENGIKID